MQCPINLLKTFIFRFNLDIIIYFLLKILLFYDDYFFNGAFELYFLSRFAFFDLNIIHQLISN